MERKLKFFGDSTRGNSPYRKEEIALSIFIDNEISSMWTAIGRYSARDVIFTISGCFSTLFVDER